MIINDAMTENLSKSRLISLDALRGFTIAGMIIVNDPGSWGSVYRPLLHAKWNGATPTDLVFPFFLFIVGVSVALAFNKELKKGVSNSFLHKKILSRTVKIFLLGLFLWLWPKFNFDGIRYAGVLQRIALVYMVISLMFLHLNWKNWAKVSVLILVAYYIIMAFVPVPGIGAPDLSEPGKNWANYLDFIALPGRLWQETWDPEGILSTFPAIVTGLTGMLAGTIILRISDMHKKLVYLFLFGFSMFLTGNVWDWFFPINKHIWTSSYVLYSSGLACMGLAFLIFLIDVKGYYKWTFLGRVFGANAITSYVLAGMMTLIFYRDQLWGFSWSKSFMTFMTGMGVQAELASLLYAVMYMLIIFVPSLILYRKKIFIKI